MFKKSTPYRPKISQLTISKGLNRSKWSIIRQCLPKQWFNQPYIHNQHNSSWRKWCNRILTHWKHCSRKTENMDQSRLILRDIQITSISYCIALTYIVSGSHGLVVREFTENAFCRFELHAHSQIDTLVWKRFWPLPVFWCFCIFITPERFRSSNKFPHYTETTRANTKCNFQIIT